MVPDDAFHEGVRRRVRGLQLKNNNCRWWHEPRILFDSVHRSVNFHLSIVAKRERERERRRRKREEKKLVAMFKVKIMAREKLSLFIDSWNIIVLKSIILFTC